MLNLKLKLSTLQKDELLGLLMMTHEQALSLSLSLTHTLTQEQARKEAFAIKH